MVFDSKRTHDGSSLIRTGVTGLPLVVVRYPEDRLGRRSEVPADVDISAEIPVESMSLGTPT
ncbi:unnamed protein product [Colletotrichum noveboracense]|uniref:Uncharacterized protein n=1 Tax=Colletotrichum noveboracense TaxID=2664923 RepID=A0A9W4RM07_9PEZI|nr:unnamed protein product [Colletotrichum noveboracense]